MRAAAILSVVCFFLALSGKSAAQDGAQAIPRESGLLELNGALHPYLLEGRGAPCVMVGPAFFYSQFFSNDLKRHIQFVLVDFKLTWMADDSVDLSQVTIASTVNEIDQVRQALGFEKICVIGNSVLGLWSLEYARAYPDHTSHAIVIGTPPFRDETSVGSIINDFFEADASEERKARLYENWERYPEDLFERLSPWEQFQRGFTQRAPLYWYDFTYDPFRHVAGYEGWMPMFEHVFTVLVPDYDPRDQFGEIEAPVFLALGRHDYMVPYTQWDPEKDRIPNLSYNLFEKSGHFPMLEEQALFDQKLIAWLERNPY